MDPAPRLNLKTPDPVKLKGHCNGKEFVMELRPFSMYDIGGIYEKVGERPDAEGKPKSGDDWGAEISRNPKLAIELIEKQVKNIPELEESWGMRLEKGLRENLGNSFEHRIALNQALNRCYAKGMPYPTEGEVKKKALMFLLKSIGLLLIFLSGLMLPFLWTRL